MTWTRAILISLTVCLAILFLIGTLSYLFFWHTSGLDSISPADGAGASLGAFAVFVKAGTVGVVSALAMLVFSLYRLRRKRLS